ncbi:hypothetical protein [Phenylobacterium sp.]|uniref:hypothetical protein n=1 Tax=Phenylobacterium sp. TaxID=1871053 RepID=UPI002DF09E4B|nr:hypothetical protein [Phenylobacterium sp.]
MPPEPEHPSAERIEHLQRRRTRLMFVQGLFFLLWQVNYFATSPSELNVGNSANHVKVAAYLVWALVLLAFLATGGGWWAPRRVREILNDEVTRDHRRRGLEAGFWGAMAATVICYAINLFEPLSTRVVIHAVLSAGVTVALLVFGMLERRAQAYG